jgi:sulfate adenylyltransferase
MTPGVVADFPPSAGTAPPCPAAEEWRPIPSVPGYEASSLGRIKAPTGRPTTLLDGDVVRKHLSSELGFSKEHRDINIRRIGFVASEITKNGGIALCAPIAPYAATRAAVREMIEAYGAFVEVHVSTSIEECERRDRKGLYKLAREGKIKEFTGISDPYEEPETPELRLDTENLDVDYCAQQVILKLENMGLIKA